MKIFTYIMSLALCLLFLASGALAQTSTTGEIEGTITDTVGAVVPGMTVTVSGPNLIRMQTATTDDQGRYRFSNLPPGKYTITVDANKGFSKTMQENVEVNLSRTTSVEFKLQAAGAAASVEVVATAGAAIDVTNNTTGTNVSSEQFSNFPTQRTVQSLYTIAPTVARSGLRDASGRDRDPSVAGSSGPENNYILDGINTSDPAFGGAGANLPFEFVQEVEIKTGAYGAEYGKSTGGVFNVITKSGGNEFHGDVFAYFTTKGMVREVTSFPLRGAAPSKFSEVDAGFDLGGPIKKDKLWFFGAFNPQRRNNTYLTQTFQQEVESKVTTPFYAGKLTYAINDQHRLTFSTFGDFTKQDGFLFRINSRTPDNGFGADLNSFRGKIETGGHNYTVRLNSVFSPRWIGEFVFGTHLQRANTIPTDSVANQSLIVDNFAVLRSGAIVPVVDTTVTTAPTNGTFISFVDGRGGTLQRDYTRQGFGLFGDQDRNRYEGAARFQNNWNKHTFKYGFEYNSNRYRILTKSTGPARTFADPFGEEAGQPFPSTTMPGGVRITNRFGVCTAVGAQAQCPAAAFTTRLTQLITAGQGPSGITSAVTVATLTDAQLSTNPILVFSSTRVRDFFLNTQGQFTTSNVQSFYLQDEYKVWRNFQINLGGRWDFQQAHGISDTSYVRLNKFWDNFQPRVGITWDFLSNSKSKFFANYAKFLETPLPLDVNVRAGGDEIQLDRNINVNRVNAPVGSFIIAGAASGLGCLGCEATPVDPSLKPQTVHEVTAGFEYEIVKDFTLGVRGIYRAQGNVIEDGSFDDGAHYFLFNPGDRRPNSTESKACSDPTIGCFGRARRYYRAIEFTATKRFSRHYQIISSYVYSSLIGNYEGLFRNDNGQADPNITSLFDLPSLLGNTYGRLPNDRPHQFKFNGSYETPWKLLISGNFYANSGTPFDALVPHPVYGDNEGFGVPRGTAINPTTGSNRSPRTYQLDLGAYYPIAFGEKRELRFQFDWFNITNTQRALREDVTVRINSGIPGAASIQFFNPFYGTGTVFQFPSTLRLGVKFKF